MTDRTIVVVGASLAGLRTVEAIRSAGHAGPLLMVGAEDHLPYDRPPLSKAFLESSEPTYLRAEESYVHDLDVDLRLGVRAEALLPATKTLVTSQGDIHYDSVVVATGADARTVPEWSKFQGVTTLRTLDDAHLVQSAIANGARIVVIGAGFIGSEVASTANALGARITILEAEDVPLVRAVGREMGAALSTLHERHGTDLRCGVSVVALHGHTAVEYVELSDGTTVPADLVVIGIGASPATDWLRDSGIELHPGDGGVVCTANLRTSEPDTYAAGDIAHWPNATFGIDMRLEHWVNAAEQGAIAGHNVVNPDDQKAYSTVPYFWSDWYGSRIQFVGIPRYDEIATVSGALDDSSFMVLYRTGDRLTGALALNQRSRIMKYRRHIKSSMSWSDALDYASSLSEPQKT